MRASHDDRGFTLPELLISIVLMGILIGVLGLAITTAMRNAPATMSRAETAVAVQGITTWLPPDVDSAEPGKFDSSITAASGCSGSDPGTNILRLQWSETFTTITTTYVADYRFVVEGDSGRIVRLFCHGEFSLGTPAVLEMSAPLAPTQPTVSKSDADGDGRTDKVRISIVTQAGETVFIEAATKNPNETLPPVATDPATTVAGTTTTSSTTSTTAPNQPPTAAPTSIIAGESSSVTFVLAATDPEGEALTATLGSLPSGWSATLVGTTVTLHVGGDGVYAIGYQVTDPHGASASSTVSATVVEGPPPSTTTTSTSTTTTSTTTSTTTTTTIPTCTVGSVAVSPASVALASNGSGKLKKDVTVALSGVSGYCVGLTLQYVTGAPNGQYIQSFGSVAPYTVTLLGHPQGTELWSTGVKTLQVRDGFDRLLATATLTVTG